MRTDRDKKPAQIGRTKAAFYEDDARGMRYDARVMSVTMLKNKLCSMGPGYCEDCGLCEYGKEYLRRTRAG